MTPDQEKLLNKAADARLIHMNEQVLFPLLHGKVEARLASLCEQFKSDGQVRLGDIAYIAACRDILMELEAKARHGDRASAKLNLNPDL